MAALNVKLVFFFLVSYTLVVLNCVALPTKSSPTSSRSRALKGPPAYRNQIVSSHRAGTRCSFPYFHRISALKKDL